MSKRTEHSPGEPDRVPLNPASSTHLTVADRDNSKFMKRVVVPVFLCAMVGAILLSTSSASSSQPKNPSWPSPPGKTQFPGVPFVPLKTDSPITTPRPTPPPTPPPTQKPNPTSSESPSPVQTTSPEPETTSAPITTAGPETRTIIRRTPDFARSGFHQPLHEFATRSRVGDGKVYMQCIERMLNGASENVTLDPDTIDHTDIPEGLRDPQDVIPLILSPTMYDSEFFKSVMCSLTDVGLRYLIIVQNSDNPGLVETMDRLMDHLRAQDDAVGRPHDDADSRASGAHVIAYGGRVMLHRHPENMFFSGSMNIGLRFGLRKSFWQVPWSVLLNADTDFGTGLAQRMTRMAHAVTARDEKRIAKLVAEVMTEPNEHTPKWRRLRTLRPREPAAGVANGKIFNPDAPAEVVSSYLLPDRVRYGSPDDQIVEFQQHYCFVFPEYRDFSGVVMSRLCVLTVGLWDENFVPAYSEDVDIIWRAYALGFKEMYVSGTGFHHYASVNIRAAKDQKFDNQRNRAEGIIGKKWALGGGPDSLDRKRPTGGAPQPYGNDHVPFDLWVKDTSLFSCVQQIAINGGHSQRCNYNINTLLDSPAIG